MRTSTHVKYQYQVCGLRWASNVPLSIPLEPSVDKKTPDVKFTLKSSARSAGELFPRKVHFPFIKNGAGHPSIAVYRVGELFLFDCHSPRTRVEFVVPRDGRWTHCYPGKETTQEEIEVWLFGLVISFLLQTRGIFNAPCGCGPIYGSAKLHRWKGKLGTLIGCSRGTLMRRRSDYSI